MYKGFGKRLFDIMLTIFVALVLSPLFAIIALMIKIFDPGPVIYKNERIGRYGKPFMHYKFRSMPVGTVDIPSDQLSEINISLIGKIIRRTSIDEMPQLYNVLKGDMSVVGPRPSLVSQDKLIELRTYNGSLECRPGLTGLAQVKSFDGMTTDQKAAYDEEYCQKISLNKDLSILGKTIIYLFRQPPVY